MSAKIILVKLNAEQVQLAKSANGERRKISRAVVCEGHGQLFGTYKQCRKYFLPWKLMYSRTGIAEFRGLRLFTDAMETDSYIFSNYEETPDLSINLGKASYVPSLGRTSGKHLDELSPNSKPAPKGFFGRLFGG